MRKYLFGFVVMALSACTLTGCKQKLKEVTGIVTSIESNKFGDTIKSITLFDGEDSLLFSTREVQYDNGIALVGDSVDVSYIEGRGDTLRALLVHVKPAPAKVVDIKTDTTKTLLTR